MKRSFGGDFGRARFERIIKGTPLCQLGNDSETIPSNTMTEFLKSMPYPISDKIAVDFDSAGNLIFTTTKRKDPLTLSLSNYTATRLPFAVLNLRDIATKLESFLESEQDGDFSSAGFRSFVLDEGLFDSASCPKNYFSGYLPQIFKERGGDDGRVREGGRLFGGTHVEERLFREGFLSFQSINKNGESNRFWLLIWRRGDKFGCTLEIPFSYDYTRSMGREDLAERFATFYERTAGDMSKFGRGLVDLAKLETVMGLFPKACLIPLVESWNNGDPPLLQIERERGSSERLFIQEPRGLSSKIEFLESPQPGKENEARLKFLGEAVIKGRWSGKLWSPRLRNIER